MKLTELEKEWPYRDLIAKLRNPFDPEIAAQIHIPPKAEVRPLTRFLELLRRRQVNSVLKTMLRPTIALPGAERIATSNASDTFVFELRDPRRVARLFVSDIIRKIRASGYGVGSHEYKGGLASAHDILFLRFIRWLVEMDALPRQSRFSFHDEQIVDLRGEDRLNLWTRTAGPILGPFADASYKDSVLLVELNLVWEVTERLIEAKGMVGPDWTLQLIKQGGMRIAELGGRR
jgi:hypothetical protein